jgi:hypothetical protein
VELSTILVKVTEVYCKWNSILAIIGDLIPASNHTPRLEKHLHGIFIVSNTDHKTLFGHRIVLQQMGVCTVVIRLNSKGSACDNCV